MFFDHFRKLVMWPPSIRWTLTYIIIVILVSSLSPRMFLFLDIYIGPWKQYLPSYTPFLLFSISFSLFLAIFSTMKYPAAKNEIANESTRHSYEKHNESHQHTQWNILKSTMKWPEILMKNLLKVQCIINENPNERAWYS